MNDEALIEIATDFRKGLLGDRSGEGCCMMVSAALAGMLNSVYQTPCQVVVSNIEHLDSDFLDHAWIQLEDGRALDPTYSQFKTDDAVLVYLGPPTEYHQT